jgi:MFS transporter, DHA2 family, multidrug resistance protein
MPAATSSSVLAGSQYHGNDKLLLGIVLAVVTFWLFAQTMFCAGDAERFANY